MKRFITGITACIVLFSCLAQSVQAENWMEGMKTGKAEFKSMGPLAFGPEGILFIADTKSAAVTAIATGDTEAATDSTPMKIDGINRRSPACWAQLQTRCRLMISWSTQYHGTSTSQSHAVGARSPHRYWSALTVLETWPSWIWIR